MQSILGPDGKPVNKKNAFLFARLVDPKPEHLADPRLKALCLPYPGLLIAHNELCPGYATLIGRLALDNSEPLGGFTYCAVGSGDPGWDPLNPPAPDGTETSLVSEFYRKTWADSYFVDDDGTPRTVPEAIANNYHIVDFVVEFTENEAVGSIMELGVYGGDATGVLGSGTLLDYSTNKVIPKPQGATISWVFRWDF